MSSDDENLHGGNSISDRESDEYDDQFDECDSGAGSDDFDLLELGQSGEEFCQVGDQTCSFPYELYDLPGFKDVLSIEVWNDILTEDDRFILAKYLPDMDQENFVLTLKELFSCENLYFGSPVNRLFEMLKEGSCEPRVAHYRQGLNFLQRNRHYHKIREHQNSMVNNLFQMRDAWMNCEGYSIEEKLRVLNIKKCQKSLMNENMEEFGSESSDREGSGDDMWGRKANIAKLASKKGQFSGYAIGPNSDIHNPGLKIVSESSKHIRKIPKGTLKLAKSKDNPAVDLIDHCPSFKPKVEMKSRSRGIGFPVSQDKAAGFDNSRFFGMNKKLLEDVDAETTYEMAENSDRNLSRARANDKSRLFTLGKKRKGPRTEDDADSSLGIHVSSRNIISALGKELITKPSDGAKFRGGGTKANFTNNFQQYTSDNHTKFCNGQKLNLSLQGGNVDISDGNRSSLLGDTQSGFFPVDSSYTHMDLNSKNTKQKLGREAVDLIANDKFSQSKQRAKTLPDKFHMGAISHGGRDATENLITKSFDKSEETESDSMDDGDDDNDDNPLMRSKWAYPRGVPDMKYGPDIGKVKLSKKHKKDTFASLDASFQPTNQKDENPKDLDFIKPERKGSVLESDNWQHLYLSERKGHVEESHGRSLPQKSSLAPGRKLKGEFRRINFPISNYMYDCSLEADLFWTQSTTADNGVSVKLGKRGQVVDPSAGYRPDISGDSVLSLMGYAAASKKRKGKYVTRNMDLKNNNDCLDDGAILLNGVNPLGRNGNDKVEDAYDVYENEVSEPPSTDFEVEVVEEQTKPQNKPFPIITPTSLTGFSFSIIHLLSSVRMAMITILPEDFSEARRHHEKSDAGYMIQEEKDRKREDTILIKLTSNVDAKTLTPPEHESVPNLPIQEIVNCVRSNPGDPSVLETQEPLLDLIRGVLKIFSSRTAPLGAKGWKPLVVYEKPSKSWSWIGPIARNISDSETIEEVTSPDAWGLPHKMLVKLVDSFAIWLKNSQEALQQIGSLPAPPLELMQNFLDEKERFKDLRAQKSLNTISPNPEEVRAYFQKEEVLRYLIPDRAFSYTAVDGKRTIVAPLRRCGGKPTSKARDHFMLKKDRPPHVTILCLVRDAAARLPGGIGTRADVCTLIRDSQYTVDDVSDAQVNQVVSGALDRLHYERDPCVQFDGERKLWVYLHREREEEDFEDDGTSSTKKWRRQKKESTDPSDPGGVNISFVPPLEQSVCDLVSDLNVEACCVDSDKMLELNSHKDNHPMMENSEFDGGTEMWNDVESHRLGENKFLYPGNPTHVDSDEVSFGGEPPP